MFQNIVKDYENNQNSYEDIKSKSKNQLKNILARIFTKQNIILYFICFFVSMVKFNLGGENVLSVFGLAILAAALSNFMPIGIIFLINGIGTFIGFGMEGLLSYIISSIVLFILTSIRKPIVREEKNEKRRIGIHLFLACIIVNIVPMIFTTFYVYDFLMGIFSGFAVLLFYKIFSNSLTVITEFEKKKVFSIEEIIGASLILAIAVLNLEPIKVFGFSLKNILCILIVLILGWKHGIMIGATSGITIGTVLGIISNSEPIIIASFAISGMFAGILNKLGKVGVIAGFILGNSILTYVQNGNIVPIINFQEILIASLGLLAIPKVIGFDIEDAYGNEKLLKESNTRALEENRIAKEKLNNISETISEMAKSYKEASVTEVEEEEILKQEENNKKMFIQELKNNLDGLEENILFEDINNSNDIQNDIYKILRDNELITKKELLNILERNNCYLVGFDTDEKRKLVDEDIRKILKAINHSYRISNLSFIWKKKIDENKKNVSKQLEGVSEAISNLANNIENKKIKFEDEKEKIRLLLKQKQIEVKDLQIEQEKTGRYKVKIYTNICKNDDGTDCYINKINKILSKVLDTSMVIQKQNCGLRKNTDNCFFEFISKDNFRLQVGLARSKKKGSPVSGDTCTQTKLDDGKILLAISDGMGSGPEARKNSKIAIKMLERLLGAGFNKENSIKLINSTIFSNNDEDMYATLDVEIFDLFAGNVEFIKNGACPTYIKKGGQVQILKSESLPAGILEDIDLVQYDKDLDDGDILVICSDGILESNKEYLNKELWIKYLLEDINTDDVQQIADILLKESIDNDYGQEKDDMTVIVAKIKAK